MSEAQLAEVNSTIHVCGKLLLGAAMSLQFGKYQVNSIFSEQITVPHSHCIPAYVQWVVSHPRRAKA